MFYLDEDSEDEEEKVPEGVYRGKAPAGILVSDIHQHTAPPHPTWNLLQEGGGTGRPPGKAVMPFFGGCSVRMNFILRIWTELQSTDIFACLLSHPHSTPSFYPSLFIIEWIITLCLEKNETAAVNWEFFWK